MKYFILILLTAWMIPVTTKAQESMDTVPPVIRSYQDNEGRLFKNHYFNFILLRDESGENTRQATGRYWEISYVYDSVFRQKETFGRFMRDQVQELGGALFFADTTQIHFAIPRDTLPNLWGKVLLRNDRVYRLQLIEEIPFSNTVDLLNPLAPRFDAYVEKVDMPEHLSFLPHTVVKNSRFSKFNHYRITFTADNRSYSQMLMGPYWDLRLEVVDENGETDKRVSSVQIMESYYRAALKAGGQVIKSKPRELIFYIPEPEAKLWVRVMTSLDGEYFIRAILQSDADETPPVSAVGSPDEEDTGN